MPIEAGKTDYKDMTRFLLLTTFLVLFCLQDSDLSAKTKGASKAEIRQAQSVIEAQGSGKTHVVIATSAGKIEIMLYDETPLHRDNFVKLAQEKVYTGVLFHRVIKGFMIQAGDPASKNALATATYGGTSHGQEIPAEIRDSYFHHRGALAAARTPDEYNPERISSGSQFYIVEGSIPSDSTLTALREQMPLLSEARCEVYQTVGGAPHLDGSYTIFGRVVKGMRTVEKITAIPTDYNDRPRKDVYIKNMTVKVHK